MKDSYCIFVSDCWCGEYGNMNYLEMKVLIATLGNGEETVEDDHNLISKQKSLWSTTHKYYLDVKNRAKERILNVVKYADIICY